MFDGIPWKNMVNSSKKFNVKIVCWICKQGHVKRNYLNQKKNEANVVSPSEETDDLCLYTHAESRSDFWFVDGGASFHYTARKEWFSDYVKGGFG